MYSPLPRLALTAQNFSNSYIDKNALLDDLNALFPEHDVMELRQALSLQSYSNLYCAVDDLLEYERQLERSKSKITVRTRVGLDRGVIDPSQRFRSEEYQKAVYHRLRLEFAEYDPSSTIRAVLSEHNYDYERTKMALAGLFAKKSFWSMFKKFFSSTKKDVAEKQLRENPLTGCVEFDEELAAIAVAKRHELDVVQIQSDLTLAQQLNEEEHTVADEMQECGCCFGDYTWDSVVSCNGGHLVCRDCVTHTAQESAFGQGDTSYNPRGLRCIAATNEKCDHVIPNDILDGVLSSDLMTRLSTRILATELESANLDLIRCPFCLYSEFKLPAKKVRLRSYWRHVVVGILVWLTLFAPIILANITIPIIICIEYTDFFEWKELNTVINGSYQRIHGGVPNGARTFKCQNVNGCGRESCIECGKEWAPFHDCLKDEKDGLRLYVEKAMADAVKRTVPCIQISVLITSVRNVMLGSLKWMGVI